MSFYNILLTQTEAARHALVATPIVQAALRGQVDRASYLAFLHEAYHHVHYTVPLLKACHVAMPSRLHWMLDAIDEYIEEEEGHDAWILEDIAACGGDADATRHGQPGLSTEIMVAYAYDTIQRRNPVGFFGMVHVLEGTSVALALQAADGIQAALGLPDGAMTYLRSHGTLDKEHTAHFALLMDMLEDAADRRAVVHGAHAFYQLYGDVFRSLPVSAAANMRVAHTANRDALHETQ